VTEQKTGKISCDMHGGKTAIRKFAVGNGGKKELLGVKIAKPFRQRTGTRGKNRGAKHLTEGKPGDA